MPTTETYLDHVTYTSKFGTEVTCTLVKVSGRSAESYSVRVVNRGSVVYEKLPPMVFGTYMAAKSYLGDIKLGLARPVI